MLFMLKDDAVEEIEPTTFSSLHMLECNIEEILRKNADMIGDDEESLMIVGQQVINAANGRSDLTAIDKDGNLVLIEIKRDREDIIHRREAFEFQAIRYAASLASIQTEDELIQNIFSPYVEKHITEFSQYPSLTPSEIAKRELERFFRSNEINHFNQKQRIILTASDFDEQTLSAVAWLCNNGIDISCNCVRPYLLDEDILIEMDKILPVMECEEYYVPIINTNSRQRRTGNGSTRRSLPKIDTLLSWGAVKSGDVLYAKGKPEETVILLENGSVQSDHGTESMQQWLKRVFNWSSVQTYVWAIHQESGKSLSEIREEYLQRQDTDTGFSE